MKQYSKTLLDHIDEKNWEAFVEVAHILQKQSKPSVVAEMQDMLFLRIDSDERASEIGTKSKDDLLKYMHYIRDNKIISANEVNFSMMLGFYRGDVQLIIDTLQHTVHDFDLHTAVDNDGLYLLNAAIMVDDPYFGYKQLIAMGCDINKINGKHGRTIHFVDPSLENAYELFHYLVEQGADPLEQIDYIPYPKAFLLDYAGGTPKFKSYREFIEQNYDYESEPDDLPDGYDEAMLDAFISVLDKMETNASAQKTVSSSNAIVKTRLVKRL